MTSSADAFVLAQLASQLSRTVPRPQTVEAAGDQLLVLAPRGGVPTVVTGVSFEPGFAQDPKRLVAEVERKLEQVQDDLSIHLRSPWPEGTVAGARPRASFDGSTLVVVLTRGDGDVELGRVS